jgi:hypothetical protein
MQLIKILPVSLLALASLAAAQHSGAPDDQPNVFLENNRPKNAKDSNTRTIEGSVKDAADNPLANSIVQLKDLKTAKIVDYATKEDGKFSFRDLPMDNNYELIAKHGDLTAQVKKVSVYDTRKYVLLNFQLTSAKR